MKKRLALLFILALVVSATACGNTEEPDITGSLKTETNNAGEDENNESQEEEIDLSMGHAEGNAYESEFIGIGFNLPEGWTFYTDEQIRELNNITNDMLDEDIAETIENANLVYDMYAQDTLGNSVNINLEKLGAVGSAVYSADEYVDASLASMKDTLTSMGFTTVTTEKTTVSLAGEELPAIGVVCSNEQVTVYEKVICKKIGQYMACITLATVQSDATDTILNQFYALD